MIEVSRTIKALIASHLTFFGLLVGLKRSFWIAAILAIGVYTGVYLISKPKMMIGNTDVEALENGEEIQAIFNEFELRIEFLITLADSIKDKSIKTKVIELSRTSKDIKSYLENNPRQISKSRYFLDYYMKTAEEIVKNYSNLDKANVSEDKFKEIKEKTSRSLDLLNEIFKRQRDSYYKDKITQLEVETDLLEQTMKLGGDIK